MSNTVPSAFTTPSPFTENAPVSGLKISRPFTALSKWSFLGIEFRVDESTAKCRLRDFVHEYPHVAGGEPETLGRALYDFDVDGVFLTNDKEFPSSWPQNITFLRSQFEEEARGPLNVPTIGQFNAYCRDWTIKSTNKMMNGERMKMAFREDQQVSQLVDIAFFPTFASLDSKHQILIEAIVKTSIKLDAFAAITQLVAQIKGIKERAGFEQAVLASKLTQLADAARFADEEIRDLNKPKFWPIVNALHDLGVASSRLAQDSLLRIAPVGVYTVPIQMTIASVSIALYGTTNRAMEIMKMNPIDEPFRIPPGTRLRYYDTVKVAA